MQQGVCWVPVSTISRAAGAATLGVLLSAALLACDKADETRGRVSTETQKRQSASGVSAREAPSKSTPAPSTIKEEHFELRMMSEGPHAVGAAEAVKIVLEAAGGYKVNQEYPYKFQLRPSPGVSYPAAIVKRDRVKLEKHRATMTVPFTPTSEGSTTVMGQFSFSVCTDEKCLIEKRELSYSFDAKLP